MDEKLFAYVIQSNSSEENTNLSHLKKLLKVVIKSLKKCTRNDDLNIYLFISSKKLLNVNDLNKISKDNEENLIKFCKEYEGSFFFLFFHSSKMLWYANFRDMNFYKMEIKSAHLIGGFAHVKWFSDKEFRRLN